jgi:ethylbenzene hydroxylase subunit beta/complex iron-sulfur molybdoenzyme family reductase subunit beta
MVMDLNKCIGCQTCTIACKRLWTRDEGMEYMWWNTVNTKPGKGTPRDWENMGGGYRDGVPKPGVLPTRTDFGEAWEYNHEEVFFGGKGINAHLKPKGDTPEWGPNWDEDQGDGEYPKTRTRGTASTPMPTTSTSRASATTARTRPVSKRAPATPSRRVKRTASST